MYGGGWRDGGRGAEASPNPPTVAGEVTMLRAHHVSTGVSCVSTPTDLSGVTFHHIIRLLM